MSEPRDTPVPDVPVDTEATEVSLDELDALSGGSGSHILLN
jgi:hypothetical protein